MSTKMSEFEQGLLQAVIDMNAGRAAKVHSGEELAARRRGRPPLPAVKVAVKLRLDADLLTTLKETGAGWQTRINDALRREFIGTKPAAETITVPNGLLLRKVNMAFLLKPATPEATEVVHILPEEENCFYA